MKTIRTIIATLATVLLGFALVAWFSVRRNAAFIQRTIYQGFDQTFVVALVMGCAFLLISIILTVAIVSTNEDDEEEEEEFRPRRQPRPSYDRVEEPYRRVSRSVEQSRYRREEESYPRSNSRSAERPVRRREEESQPVRRRTEDVPRRRERMAERPDEMDLERREAPVRKKAAKPVFVEEPEEIEEVVEAPDEEIEEAAEPETLETEPEEADEPRQEETVHCIYCGGKMSRKAEVCPHCGKKR